jgi:hypothetical protein
MVLEKPGRDGPVQLGQSACILGLGALPARATNGILSVLVPGLEVEPVGLVVDHNQTEHALQDLDDRLVTLPA